MKHFKNVIAASTEIWEQNAKIINICHCAFTIFVSLTYRKILKCVL